MFNPFHSLKKSQSTDSVDNNMSNSHVKNSTNDATDMTDMNAQTQGILLNYQLHDQPILNRIRQTKHQGDTLTLDIVLTESDNPEQIHRELHKRLNPIGIHEINLNVILQKTTLKPASTAQKMQATLPKAPLSKAPLPKTIDASQPKLNTHQSINQGIDQKADQSTDKNADKNIEAGVSASQLGNQSISQSSPQPISQSSTQATPKTSKQPPKQSELPRHPRIQHILVVASGKGGVGKSTTAVNLALALQQQNKRVGILDADIYGPSIPAMLGVADKRPELENEQFVPIDAQGLAMLSIGSLLDAENTPVAWRGPKATGALMQLFGQTNWPNLDYLLIDMPPGTGDIQLTLAQRIPVTGAIIVTTPQHIALLDAQKGIEMFSKTHIPVIGLVENMALHVCSNCGHAEAIFGEGGGETVSERYQVPLLGQLPLAKGIREQMDMGCPSVIADDGRGDDFAQHYRQIATRIDKQIEHFAKGDNQRIF